MKTMRLFLLLLLITCTVYYSFYANQYSFSNERPNFQTVHDVANLFPSTAPEIRVKADNTIAQAKRGLELLYTIKAELRTFGNTMHALDLMKERYSITGSSLYVLTQVSPREEVRNAAQEAIKKLDSFAVDHFSVNFQLYKACLEYEKSLEDPTFAARESLTAEEKRYVKETMSDFRRFGLQLPVNKREQLKHLQKEISLQEIAYNKAIADANKSFTVQRKGLEGVSESFISSLEKNCNDAFILQVDGPTLDELMRTCAVAQTREQMYKEYMQRGYPENEKTLATIIRLRDERAKILGYQSCAHFEIEQTMAKTPHQVVNFLSSLASKAQAKASREMNELKKDLPKGVVLTKEGKIKPSDLMYLRNQYKKKYLDIDELEISHYFPLSHTLPAILDIYEKFFGLTIKKIEASGLWHEDVELFAVYKDAIYRGAVLLDLFPRPSKFTHAATAPLVPSILKPDGEIYPGVVLMMANFPPAQKRRPALLKWRDVITFFHELGHVIHSLMGATTLAGFAGTNVKRDFVEMPSQMLESWLYDRDVLTQVSSHYKTKKSLPDDLIQKIQDLKNFDAGDLLSGQLTLAFTSLTYFLAGANKDVAALWKEMCEKYRSHLAYDPDNRFYCGFSQLTSYGSCCYGYLWSKVYALDLFNHIRQHGLLNRAIGERYTAQVLSKGGSINPAILLRTFLGREPNAEAFFRDVEL